MTVPSVKTANPEVTVAAVCAEYLYFDRDGTIRFIPLTQEGLSATK